jgi:hypothetical protein
MVSLSWLEVLQQNSYSNRHAKETSRLNCLFTAFYRENNRVRPDGAWSQSGTFDAIARQIF